MLRYICNRNLIRCQIPEDDVNNGDGILEDLKNDGIENPKTLVLKIVNSEIAPRTKNNFIKDLTKNNFNQKIKKKFVVNFC